MQRFFSSFENNFILHYILSENYFRMIDSTSEVEFIKSLLVSEWSIWASSIDITRELARNA